MHMPDIATLLSRRRLQWAGHVLRMGEERSPRRTLTSWIPTARPKGRPHLTFAQGLVKDLAYAGLNTSNWGVLAADRRAWRTTLNNLGIDGAKLIASACAAAATAVVARGLALSASMIAAADAEVARIVPLEQVEPAKRAAAAAEAAAPTSTAASRQKKGRRGGGSRKRLQHQWPHGCAASAQAESRWLKTTPPSARGEPQTLIKHVCMCAYPHIYIYVCVYTYTYTCMLTLSRYVFTHIPVPILANILRTHAHTHAHAYTHTLSHTSHIHTTRSSWALLLKNLRLTHFLTKNSQCICLV